MVRLLIMCSVCCCCGTRASTDNGDILLSNTSVSSNVLLFSVSTRGSWTCA